MQRLRVFSTGRCAGLLGRCRSWSDTSSGILTTVTSTSESCGPPLQRCACGASATCRDCDASTSDSLLLPHLIGIAGVVDRCGGRDQLLNWHKGTESGLDNSPLWQAPNAPLSFPHGRFESHLIKHVETRCLIKDHSKLRVLRLRYLAAQPQGCAT